MIVVGRAPLESLQSVAVEAVMPLFRAAVDDAEQHILRMHSQDFGTATAPDVAGASPYMAQLTRHIALFRSVSPLLQNLIFAHHPHPQCTHRYQI